MSDAPRAPSNMDIISVYKRTKRLGLETAPYPRPFELTKLTPGTRPDGKPAGWDLFSNYDKMVWTRQQQREAAKRAGRYPG